MQARGTADQSLREVQDRFISAWGQMGGAWGISRTMGEIHALLYVTGEVLCTDDIMARLQISRGNASMSLRALVEWGIVMRVSRRGDRKEYFRAEQDVWTLFRAIVRERMAREVEPLMASLHEIRDTAEKVARSDGATPAGRAGEEHLARIENMLSFFEMLTKLSTRFVSPSGGGLKIAAKMLTRIPSSGSAREKTRQGGPVSE